MRTAATRPRRRGLLAVTIPVVGAVLASVLLPITVPTAQALPTKCDIEVTWHDGATAQRDDGALVETGIHSTSDIVCGPATVPAGPPDEVGTGDEGGWGDVPTGPPAPPAPPGPVLPKPPVSVPPTAGPPCVPGANNVASPGTTTDGTTGDGGIMFDNLTEAVNKGDLKIEYSAGAKITTIDLNLGPSTSGGDNPYEGMTPEEATQALYWPDGFDPTYSEIGRFRAASELVKTVVKYAVKGARGNNQSLAAFRNMVSVLDTPLMRDVIAGLKEKIEVLNQSYRTNLSPELREVILILWQEVEGIMEMMTDIDHATPVSDPALTYIEVASAATPGTSAGHSNGVCGQIKQAVSMTASSLLGVVPTGNWAQITLAGTDHGTLVPKIQALTAPLLQCPTAEVQGVLNRENSAIVTSGCSGTVASARLLTRKEISELSHADQESLMSAAAADPLALSVFRFEHDALAGSVGHLPGPDSFSGAGYDTSVHFFGDSKDGRLNYTTTRKIGTDYLVVAATDTAGVEHPFIVKMVLADPASCDKQTDRDVGTTADGFVTRLKNDRLQVQRNTPFAIDLKQLCTTDYRHTYQVVVDSYSDDLKSTVNPDGTVTFDWIDPDVIGTSLIGLKVTAWDEVTGAPSAPVDFLLDVKDVQYECNDVEIDYDRSEMKGAPLEIPVDCSMAGGVDMLESPFIRHVEGSYNDGYDRDVPGGRISTDGKTVTFTPSSEEVDLISVKMDAWSRDPMGNLGRDPKPWYDRVLVHSEAFFVDIRFSE